MKPTPPAQVLLGDEDYPTPAEAIAGRGVSPAHGTDDRPRTGRPNEAGPTDAKAAKADKKTFLGLWKEGGLGLTDRWTRIRELYDAADASLRWEIERFFLDQDWGKAKQAIDLTTREEPFRAAAEALAEERAKEGAPN